MRIAFCGLGRMGSLMARRIPVAGHDLTVWNRSRDKAEPFADIGARVATSPADASRDADVVITMLADPDAVEHVVLGADGIAETISPDAALIEMSTIGPDAVAALRARLPQTLVIDAPVLGSVVPAERGELTVIVGATQESFARWQDVLSIFGRPTRAGGPGAGAALKLVANGALLVSLVELGEALALADAQGLDRDITLDVLEQGLFGSVARYKRDKIESGVFEPAAFPLRLGAKDVRLAVDTAARAGRTLRLAEAALRAYSSALEAGDGDLDFSAVVRHAADVSAH